MGQNQCLGLGGELRVVGDSGLFGEETELLGTAKPPHFTEGHTEAQRGKATGPRSQLHSLPGIGSRAQGLEVAEGVLRI